MSLSCLNRVKRGVDGKRPTEKTWKTVKVKAVAKHFLETINIFWENSKDKKVKEYMCITKKQFLDYFKNMADQREIHSIWNSFDPKKLGYTGAIELVLGLSSKCGADTNLIRMRTAFKVMDDNDNEHIDDVWFEIYFTSIYKVLFACNKSIKTHFPQDTSAEKLAKEVVSDWMKNYPWNLAEITFIDFLKFMEKSDPCFGKLDCSKCGKKESLCLLGRYDVAGFKNEVGHESRFYLCKKCSMFS